MNFIKEKIKDFFLLDTKVENIFINEYMPSAPGDFVKVYLYASMYAEHGLEITEKAIAKQLGLSEEKVREAWEYWEERGVIRKRYFDTQGNVSFIVEFLSLKEQLYGKNTAPVRGEASRPKGDNVFGNPEVKVMFKDIEKALGRTLDSSELGQIMKWLTDYGASPEVVFTAVKYSIDKNKTSMRYIESVVKGWTEEGLQSTDQISEKLQEMDEKYYRYRRVLKALGFTRNATEAEKEMMDNWFERMGYSMDRVLEACTKTAGISSPNFNYVNKVLENWRDEAQSKGVDVNTKIVVTQAVLNQYYDYLRDKAEKEAEERKQEVYQKLPRIKDIDEEIRRMGSQLSKALILGSSENESKKINSIMDELAAERAVVLTENNFEMDYTDIKYACEKCSDTGMTDLGERCSCIKQRTEEAEIWIKKKSLEK
ncbi:DnaD domain protein [Anaerovoracaceae bacterium 41-7]|jgi:DnaD/phage-associated family protein|uniref:DnaD domain protein n=1 Tax=Anaerotruncus colihominis TaxID=169435 RepID=A0A845QFK0_9FIRM|nr:MULTISPECIES: DnaD domain protein [Clostridia]MCI9476335.1 DnaD domain protein [Emergencia sp.]NBH60692.1 DnaD domain protein [Anaerotruncus colihominis]NCE99378.1 DnaD domain protein [Emergencia sp. 1XD21-10]NCF01346.1 DnaD domain protein [Anaerotruncus sp. 80]